MISKLIPVALASVFLLGGCAQNSSTDAVAPEKGDPDFLVARNTHSELYLNPETSRGAASFREIYIAPVDLSKMQIIQPEGVTTDEEWKVTDVEKDFLQNNVAKQFSTQLSYESAYNVVERREQADMVVHTTVVAIHPYATRDDIAAGAKAGGAITISLALINAETGLVMLRSVDTKSTDNIWAFNQIDNDEQAIDLIFRAWGANMRRGLLQLQGRSSDPLAEPFQLKPQTK
ncbi:MAG: DUF3313 family protein [Halioglobus sp.]